jgi:ABC-type multidrug transport system fused ATPase/permease subunit
MPRLRRSLGADKMCDRGFQVWQDELDNSSFSSSSSSTTTPTPTSASRPSLLRALWKMHGGLVCQGLLFGALQGVFNASARPIMLNYLILAFTPGGAYTLADVVGLLVIFAAIVLLEGWFKVIVGNLLGTEAGANMLAWLIPLIHRKAARISRIDHPKIVKNENSSNTTSTSTDNADPGGATSEVSLVGKDCLETAQNMHWLANFPQCAVGLVAGCATLVWLLGASALVGLATMAVILFFNRLFANCGGRVAKSELEAADARITVMKEVIESIVPLKLMCWEDPYLSALDAKREAECKQIYKMRQLTVMSITIGRIAPVMAACTTFTYMGLSGQPLTPNLIFAALATYNALRLPLITIPLNFIQMSVMQVSLRRITGFLLLPEHQKHPAPPVGSDNAVDVAHATFDWSRAGRTTNDTNDHDHVGEEEDNKNTTTTNKRYKSPSTGAGFALQNVQFTVKKGSLVGIVGRVGSGKSTLLSSILGEVPMLSGKTTVTAGSAGGVGFVPQKAFVMSGSVLDNILMGRPLNRKALGQAIFASDFARDLKLMPGGLYTEIGERGVTLSGGQKQRLAVARAIYAEPGLLVIDDALAAVDGKVAGRIFDRVCNKRRHLGTATTIMALNQLNLLPQFDHIVMMEAREHGGTLLDQGTYDELMERCPSFRTMVVTGGPAGKSLDEIGDADSDAAEDDKEVGKAQEKNAGTEGRGGGGNGNGAGVKEELFDVDSALDRMATAGAQHVVAELDEDTGETKASVTKSERGKLVQEDTRNVGELSRKAIVHYLKAAGGWRWFSLTTAFGLVAYGLMAYTDLWLATWVTASSAAEMASDASGGSNATTAADITTAAPSGSANTPYYAGVYVSLSCAHALGVLSLSLHNNAATNRASRGLHHDSVKRILHAPSSWFQATPSGRIMSRFSGDLAMMDHMFAHILDDILQFSFLILGLLVTISYVIPEMIAVLVVGLVVYGVGVVAVDRTNREAKRETNLALSPVITVLAETITGRALIHAMSFESYFEEKERRAVDEWNRHSHFGNTAVQWGTYISNIVAFVFSVSAAVIVYAQRERFPNVAVIGVALNYSFVLPYFLGLYSIMMMMLFNGVTSVERVLDYITSSELPQERPWSLPNDPTRKGGFPGKGALSLEDVSLRYRPSLPDAIKGISIVMKPGENIGIVGRTGAGKSSLIAALFQIIDHPLRTGNIVLDGVDLGKIGLHTARKALAIIPQTPLLLTPGSVFHNIDPFGKHSRDEIEAAISKVGLDTDRTLYVEASELSAGQQQLLAVARLLLLEEAPSVVVMDEPSSNIDAQTDATLQRVIKDEFDGVTMLTIAHRLETVIGCDRMMVMDAGRVVECGAPNVLLGKEGGVLAGMVDALGEAAAVALRRQAANIVKNR